LPINANDLVKCYKNNKLADVICISTKLERNGIAVIQILGGIIKKKKEHT